MLPVQIFVVIQIYYLFKYDLFSFHRLLLRVQMVQQRQQQKKCLLKMRNLLFR